MRSKVSGRVRSYLDAHFPGSPIDEGYYFVAFKAGAHIPIDDALLPHISARLALKGTWIVAVGVDPRPYVRSAEVEERLVTYNADWNAEQRLTQWFVELGAPGVEIRELLDAETVPGAAAIIDPDRHLILNANTRRLYAKDRRTLDEFLVGMSATR